jgi:hypothetical protein
MMLLYQLFLYVWSNFFAEVKKITESYDALFIEIEEVHAFKSPREEKEEHLEKYCPAKILFG